MSSSPRDASKAGSEVPANNVVPLQLAYDATAWIRIGIALLVLGIGGFFLWAATAPLDEGVPVPGTLTIDSKRKSVQHLSGGIVKKLYVREAQLVKAGEMLVELDDVMTRANFDSLRQNYVALRAAEARLRAEQSGARSVEFPTELSTSENAAVAHRYIPNQRQLFDARRAALQGDIGILNEAAAAQEEVAKGLQGQLGSRQAQWKLLQEQLAGTRDLVREGYLPRNTQLEQERMAAELGAITSDLQANILRTAKAISELRLRATQRKQEYQREVETLLSDVLREASATAERLVMAREELHRSVIVSPADGQVVGLTVFTIGGVIGPGQKLMDIVPIGEGLVLEAKIPPHLIDRMQAGLPADISFQGFVSQPQLVVEGKVLSVSADLLIDAGGPGQPSFPHYLARVAVTPEGMKKLERHTMQPGMPADVVIKTGERTVLNYLLKPLLQRVAVSLKES